MTWIQRFGGALNLNLHYHMISIDGAFFKKTDEMTPKFYKLRKLTTEFVEKILIKIHKRVIHYLKSLGVCYEEEGRLLFDSQNDQLASSEPDQSLVMKASVQGTFTLGSPGKLTQRVKNITKNECFTKKMSKKSEKQNCVHYDGFSLHADVKINGNDRHGLENLIGYTSRGAVANSRLSQPEDWNGDYKYELKNPWDDGTKAIRLTPMELMERLAALISPPWFNLLRYHGVFANRHPLRDQIILNPRVHSEQDQDGGPVVGKYSWSQLIKRSFGVDTQICFHCGVKGRMQFISSIEDTFQARKVLEASGLRSIPPPITPPLDNEHTFM